MIDHNCTDAHNRNKQSDITRGILISLKPLVATKELMAYYLLIRWILFSLKHFFPKLKSQDLFREEVSMELKYVHNNTKMSFAFLTVLTLAL